MSLRQNIEVFHPLDIRAYLEALEKEYQARVHPADPDSFLMLESNPLPFHSPKWREDHVSILGFNYAPLPYALIQVLVDHPELAPDDTPVRWTEEQELILENSLGQLRKPIPNHDS